MRNGVLLRRWLSALTLGALAFAAREASAWDGVATGQIVQLDGVGSAGGAPNNGDLRVFLAGSGAPLCGAGSSTWGFLDSTDVNFKGLLAMLLAAQLGGKSVTMYMNAVSGGVCQIGYIVVRS